MRTTIVGGRPPGAGTQIGAIPHNLEILIQKAAVDPEFKVRLLEKRSAAAAELEMTLGPAEVAMLDAVPAEQLEAIIAGTKVPEKTRRALLGKVAVASLGVAAVAVLNLATLGITPDRSFLGTQGIRPDHPIDEGQDNQPGGDPPADDTMPVPPASQPADVPGNHAPPELDVVTRGIRPDRPPSERN
ncbi:MAG: hypothetical protein GXY55_15520 [Phycisphaerae bacterium]|nr:hypothetical protein [Phycisphaerae bacterium]